MDGDGFRLVMGTMMTQPYYELLDVDGDGFSTCDGNCDDE